MGRQHHGVICNLLQLPHQDIPAPPYTMRVAQDTGGGGVV